jgi:hypothetical protein
VLGIGSQGQPLSLIPQHILKESATSSSNEWAVKPRLPTFSSQKSKSKPTNKSKSHFVASPNNHRVIHRICRLLPEF